MSQTLPSQEQTDTRYGKMRYYAEDPTIGRSLLLYGEYCHQEIETILSMLDKDSVYVDVGANIGTHSVSIAPHVAHVHAFEPNFENLYLLERNTKSHQNITVYSKAASDHKEFGYTEFNFGKTVYARATHKGQHPRETLNRSKLLDSYEWPRVDFVKIDTEGHELQVLQGMGYILSNNRPCMLVEMQDETKYSEIYDWLSMFEYKMYWFPVATYNPNNWKNNTKDVFGKQHGVINWICTPDLINTTLQPVVDREDTVERMNYRQRQ